MRNSLVVALAVGVIATAIGTAAAMALVRLAPSVRGLALTVLSLPVMLPPLVLAVALVVFFLRLASPPLSLATVVAGHVLITLPFVVLVVLARLARFDFACVDAGMKAGVPILTFDSDSSKSNRLLFVGTDNYDAGFAAGTAVGQQLGDRAPVGVSLIPGLDSTTRATCRRPRPSAPRCSRPTRSST